MSTKITIAITTTNDDQERTTRREILEVPDDEPRSWNPTTIDRLLQRMRRRLEEPSHAMESSSQGVKLIIETTNGRVETEELSLQESAARTAIGARNDEQRDEAGAARVVA